MTSNRAVGFTLMEMIVVVAIIAIIGAIAYPNFVRVKMETRRADATSAVIATEAVVQRYLAENNKANLDSSDMSTAEFANYSASSGTPVLSNGGYYIITIVPNSTSYSINATATAAGVTNDCSTKPAVEQCADTACRVISLNNGQKQSTNSTGTVADATTTTCW